MNHQHTGACAKVDVTCITRGTSRLATRYRPVLPTALCGATKMSRCFTGCSELVPRKAALAYMFLHSFSKLVHNYM